MLRRSRNLFNLKIFLSCLIFLPLTNNLECFHNFGSVPTSENLLLTATACFRSVKERKEKTWRRSSLGSRSKVCIVSHISLSSGLRTLCWLAGPRRRSRLAVHYRHSLVVTRRSSKARLQTIDFLTPRVRRERREVCSRVQASQVYTS